MSNLNELSTFFSNIVWDFTIKLFAGLVGFFIAVYFYNSAFLPHKHGEFYITSVKHINAKTKIAPIVTNSQAATTIRRTKEHILLIGDLKPFDDEMFYDAHRVVFEIGYEFKDSFDVGNRVLCEYVKYRLSNEYEIINIEFPD